MPPEQEARAEIDKLLAAAGWSVQPRSNADLTAAQGVAICEYPLKQGHGFADYLLYVDGAAVGVIEAKKTGVPLTAVEIQTAKYSEGLSRRFLGHYQQQAAQFRPARRKSTGDERQGGGCRSRQCSLRRRRWRNHPPQAPAEL